MGTHKLQNTLLQEYYLEKYIYLYFLKLSKRKHCRDIYRCQKVINYVFLLSKLQILEGQE